MTRVPLSILDLSPVPSGGTPGQALRDSLDLVRRAEEFGYHRYWFAEHHLAAGVAGSAPQILIALAAAATSRIRVGSGAVQTGHWTPLAIAEQFATIDALYPGRVDLGIGRSGQRRKEITARAAAPPPSRERHVVDGLLIPEPFDFRYLATSPVVEVYQAALQQPGAEAPQFGDLVDDLVGLLDGTYRSPAGTPARSVPGAGHALELWILGSTAGESARVAGERGLPFAANYHVSPATVLEAVDAYRSAFKPSGVLDAPHVLVSADVVVAGTDAEARELATGYAAWVHSIWTGQGAVPFPTPQEAAAHPWDEESRRLVKARVDTQFTGAPATVLERLETLRRVTGADELLVTTITHDHADRVRSYALLAEAWREG
ncbi:LLM class flavin-dependent oxidoreductase [Actinomadura flavalba]|uniref:LLM class flavin-dependent oxidoreductase n=1 Tax=Actinomadura flavalba TaxID=1120938 RepID=UPI0003811E0F|nr:LLM class flavin-dependent oxidoreductase [Actinomadura flavalba]